MQAQLTCVASTIERLSLMLRGFGRYNTIMQVSILSLAKKPVGFLPERREEKRQEENIAVWEQQRSNSKHTGCGAGVGMAETGAGRDRDGEKQHHLPCLLASVGRCESTLYWEEPPHRESDSISSTFYKTVTECNSRGILCIPITEEAPPSHSRPVFTHKLTKT